MTNKQINFINEYLKSKNATEAAIKAGYSPKTAASQASELLKKPNISKEIDKILQKASENALVSAEYVIRSLKEVAERCLQHKPVLDYEGNETGEYEFDSSGANKALELLGRNLKLFTDKVEVEASENLAEALAAAIKRVHDKAKN